VAVEPSAKSHAWSVLVFALALAPLLLLLLLNASLRTRSAAGLALLPPQLESSPLVLQSPTQLPSSSCAT
jgi:hypothetical protein